MTFGCLMISIRTHLGWVMLAKGKRAVTGLLRVVHGRPGAYVCIFIFSLLFYHLPFTFTKETKVCF